MTPTDSNARTTQIGITASLVVHVLLLLFFGWWMGLGKSARHLVQQARKALEQPKVTMLFPKQITEVAPAPKPVTATVTLGAPTKQYVRSTDAAPAVQTPPGKADFASDKTTVAAAVMAPFPAATSALPTQLAGQQPAVAMAQPKPTPSAAPTSPKVSPTVSPLLPREPLALPELSAKQAVKKDGAMLDALNAQIQSESDRLDVSRLPFQVRKASAADAPPAPNAPSMMEPKSPALEPLPTIAKAIPTLPGKVKGGVANRGADAVNAIESPIGKYEMQVEAAFGAKWEELRGRHAKELLPGSLRLNFFLTFKGKQENAQIIDNLGSKLLETLALEAWKSTEYPPFPEALIKEGNTRLEFTHHVIIIP